MQLKKYLFLTLLFISFFLKSIKQSPLDFNPIQNHPFIQKFCLNNKVTHYLSWQLSSFLYSLRFTPDKKDVEKAEKAIKNKSATDNDYNIIARYVFTYNYYDINEIERIVYKILDQFYGPYANPTEDDFILAKRIVILFKDIILYEKQTKRIQEKDISYKYQRNLTLDMLKSDSLIKIMYDDKKFYEQHKYYFMTMQDYLNGNNLWMKSIKKCPYAYLLKSIKSIVETNFTPTEIVKELQFWIKILFNIKEIYEK